MLYNVLLHFSLYPENLFKFFPKHIHKKKTKETSHIQACLKDQQQLQLLHRTVSDRAEDRS